MVVTEILSGPIVYRYSPLSVLEGIFDSVNRSGGGPVNLKVLMLLYPIHTIMSTEEVKQKKEKKVKVDTEVEVVGDEGVKKEKKDKKRKDREEEEVKPAEVSSSGEIIGETKEQRKARKKAKKEVMQPHLFCWMRLMI